MNPQILLLSVDVPSGRVFGLDQQTLVQICIQLLNAGFLAAVLSFILYKPVRNFMAKRTGRIESQLAQAAEELEKADGLKAQYEEKLSNIELERDQIIELARNTAAERSRQMLSEAKNEADAIMARAKIEAELEQSRVKDAVKQSVIETSFLIAEKFVTANIDKGTQDKLFDEAVAELEETTWQS